MTQPGSVQSRPNIPIGPFLLAILTGIFLGLVLQISHRIATGHSGDFRHFYFAAGALLDHRDLYGPVPPEVVTRGLGRPPNKEEKNWYTTDSERYLYPPLIAMLYTPLARLRFDTAQRIILIIDAFFAYIGVLLTTRIFVDRFALPRTTVFLAAVALLGTLLNIDKIHLDLQMFQTNSLMFFMFALSLFLIDRNPVIAGVPLGIIFNIKYLSIGLLPWLLIRRRWDTAAGYLGSIIFFALLPAVISGWNANLHNIGIAEGGLLHMLGISHGGQQANVDDIRDLLSCSITSAMARTTTAGQSLLRPMLYCLCIAIAAVGAAAWRYRRQAIPIFLWPDHHGQTAPPWRAIVGIEFVSIVAATLCFSPQTNTRHLMLALLITIPLSALVIGTQSRASKMWAAAGALAIGVGFIFPPGGQAEKSAAVMHAWSRIGGQCWCLLFATLVLVWIGVQRATESSAAPQRSEVG